MESQIEDEKYPIQQTEQRDVPHDLISESILPRLPIKSVLRFKSVSKLWYSTLSSSRFAFAHLKFFNPSPTESFLIRTDKKFQIMSYTNGKIDLVNVEVDFDVGREEMDLVGTSNGLVCLASRLGRFFIIWNPITREFHKYLYTEHSQAMALYTYLWGFGYCSHIDDYKVVRIYKTESCTSLMVHVYSLRSDKWRKINFEDNVVVSLWSYPLYTSTCGLFVNEKLYWMVEETIISFDLVSERFDDTFSHLELTTPMPNATNNDDVKYFEQWLCVVNGCLSMCGEIRGSNKILSIRKSREEIEQIILPENEFSRDPVPCQGIIGFTGSYKILSINALCVGLIDLDSRPLTFTSLTTLENASQTDIVSYCSSLISPNALVIRTPKDDDSNIYSLHPGE